MRTARCDVKNFCQFTDFLEETGRHSPAKSGVEHTHGVAALVASDEAWAAHDDVGLLKAFFEGFFASTGHDVALVADAARGR